MSNITMHEVSKHKTVDDCWVVAHGKVYDITEFVKRHPGGKFVIKSNAGKDVSRHFDNHPKKAHIIWENYLIGEISKQGGCCFSFN